MKGAFPERNLGKWPGSIQGFEGGCRLFVVSFVAWRTARFCAHLIPLEPALYGCVDILLLLLLLLLPDYLTLHNV